MALPDPKNLAYEGQASGSGKCAAWGGFFCVAIGSSWREIVRFTLFLARKLNFNVER